MQDNTTDIVNNNTNIRKSEQGYNETHTGNHGSQPNPQGRGEAQPVSDRETCTRGREGLRTYAGVAISARDISVGEMITDHPP